MPVSYAPYNLHNTCHTHHYSKYCSEHTHTHNAQFCTRLTQNNYTDTVYQSTRQHTHYTRTNQRDNTHIIHTNHNTHFLWTCLSHTPHTFSCPVSLSHTTHTFSGSVSLCFLFSLSVRVITVD